VRTYLGVEDLRELLLDIIDRHPDSRNPVSAGGFCHYELDGEHCLIGKLAAEQGWEMPPTRYDGTGVPGALLGDVLSASSAAIQYGWPVTVYGARLLDLVQARADRRAPGDVCRSWSELSRYVELVEVPGSA